MSNIIDKIQISGQSYNVKDSSAATVVELTQQEYDNLPSSAKTGNTLFVITDATAGDLTNYYTKTETDTLLDAKQATLQSGTNIKTINNESILGSGNIDIQGGSTYTAGRGISIANDTISFTLPVSAGTGTNSIKCGENSQASGSNSFAIGSDGVKASGKSSFAGGSYSEAKQVFSMAFGRYNITNNYGEVALGFFNKSNGSSSAAGNSSGNTLFSVGNGTNNTSSTRHNAFEIRQNGDIYLTLNGQDVKLQDQLGGSSITVDTALDSGSTNPVENRVIYNKIDEVEQVTAAALNNINDRLSEDEEVTAAALNNINDRLSEDEEVTAAGLNAVNDKFDGLKLKKLTQAEYDALTTKDSNTLYIVI